MAKRQSPGGPVDTVERGGAVVPLPSFVDILSDRINDHGRIHQQIKGTILRARSLVEMRGMLEALAFQLQEAKGVITRERDGYSALLAEQIARDKAAREKSNKKSTAEE